MPSFCLTCKVSLELKEPVYGVLMMHGMAGSEERESSSEVTVEAYFSTVEERDTTRAALEELTSGCVTRIYTVEDQDWNAKWRETMQPVLVAPHVWVSPEWLPPPLAAGDRWIKIEPKMAFGTGHHETTRLAAQAVIRRVHSGKVGLMLDIGTGSGVLCFVAALCGVPHTVGVEIDLDCCENLNENRVANALGSRADFIIGDIECLRHNVRFDLVVMNMIYPQSAPLLPAIRDRLLAPGGAVVWSGILAEGRQEALDAAAAAGFLLVNEAVEREWWAGELTHTGR